MAYSEDEARLINKVSQLETLVATLKAELAQQSTNTGSQKLPDSCDACRLRTICGSGHFERRLSMWNKISVVGMPRPGDYSVLAYNVNGSVEMVHCDDLNWSAGLRLYTHWMELPSPPWE